MLDINQTTVEQPQHKKHIIYQLLVRYFGNKNETNKTYGTIAENGCGKFNDITAVALKGIKELGTTHVWYTGIIEHATMTDYTAFGIKPDDPDVVKGIAGSPYAIKDYYDVHPDLATNITRRMDEFEALVERTHSEGLKVIIDFIPNHVARSYRSDVLPQGISDLGQDDDVDIAFSPKNDFYYVAGKKFLVPYGYQPGGVNFSHALKDGHFDEFPAKATGNNVFRHDPSIDDWFETIKLNYGWDLANGGTEHFDPRPPLWQKMFDILCFWAKKGVDAFRCDMAEMIPIAFWEWVIPAVKSKFPQVLFIAEAYDTRLYAKFLNAGQFDFLYDKVGMYDIMRKLVSDDLHAHVNQISDLWRNQCNGMQNQMLRFLENHDEVRIASTAYASNPWFATPAMVVASTLFSGPLLIYNGQEVGEPAKGEQGFSGNDGRSTIFDYWGLPQHQKWMNNGLFDGGALNDEEKRLRQYYITLLNLCKESQAINQGQFYELMQANQFSAGFNGKVYAFARFYQQEKLVVLANFNRHAQKVNLYLPYDLKAEWGLENQDRLSVVDLLSNTQFISEEFNAGGIWIEMYPTSALILRI